MRSRWLHAGVSFLSGACCAAYATTTPGSRATEAEAARAPYLGLATPGTTAADVYWVDAKILDPFRP